jgi:hypothetical protein
MPAFGFVIMGLTIVTIRNADTMVLPPYKVRVFRLWHKYVTSLLASTF